jgi:hypothetical protein
MTCNAPFKPDCDGAIEKLYREQNWSPAHPSTASALGAVLGDLDTIPFTSIFAMLGVAIGVAMFAVRKRARSMSTDELRRLLVTDV